jgi:hypothetical protein
MRGILPELVVDERMVVEVVEELEGTSVVLEPEEVAGEVVDDDVPELELDDDGLGPATELVELDDPAVVDELLLGAAEVEELLLPIAGLVAVLVPAAVEGAIELLLLLLPAPAAVDELDELDEATGGTVVELLAPAEELLLLLVAPGGAEVVLEEALVGTVLTVEVPGTFIVAVLVLDVADVEEIGEGVGEEEAESLVPVSS